MSEARASGSTVDRVYTPTVTRVKTVRVIPPTIQPLSDIPAFSARPRRVAAYARVSTSSEEQLNSYEAQVKHYTEYIKSKETSDNWQFVDVYTDKGITGVSTKKREGFNRMIQDALAGKIDLIITKSVSRFARNTVDTLTAIRKLKEYGVEVYFEEQNIYTLDGKGEVLLTIMSSIAQEESRNISENVTWGMRKRFADGKVTMPYGQFMGYRRGKDGTPEVVEAEAEIVRTIFRRFLEGATPAMISRELNLAGIPCPSRKSLLSENEAEIAKARKKTSRWGTSTVENILANEKYKGDAILQKTYCTDYLLKTFVVNDGSVVPKYYAENSHPAIVSPEVVRFGTAGAGVAQKPEWQIQRRKLFCLSRRLRELRRVLRQQGLAQHGRIPTHGLALQQQVRGRDKMRNASCNAGSIGESVRAGHAAGAFSERGNPDSLS